MNQKAGQGHDALTWGQPQEAAKKEENKLEIIQIRF